MLYQASERYRPIRGGSSCTIGHHQLLLDALPSVSVTLSQPFQRNSCDVVLRTMWPEDVAGQNLRVMVSTGDGRQRTVYTGVAQKRTASISSVERTIVGVDRLVRLSKSVKDVCSEGGILFSKTPIREALQYVLNLAGITDQEIDHITLPPGAEEVMLVGAVADICHDATENLDGIFNELLTMCGCAAYCKPQSGMVCVVPLNRTPLEIPTIRFSNTDGGYRWMKVKQELMGVEGLCNSFTAAGPEIEMGIAPSATWESDIVEEGRSEETSCEYWQTLPQVAWAAEFYGRLACRERVVYTIDVPLDYDLCVGRTIAIHAPHAGLTNALGYVTSVSHRGTTTSMTAEIGPGEEGYLQQEDQSFLADFTIWIDAELVYVNGSPVTRYIVHCAAKPDDRITNYAWTLDGTTAMEHDAHTGNETPIDLPSSPEAYEIVFLVTTIMGVSVTLTVTTAQGEVSQTQALDSPLVEVCSRILQCGGTAWAILPGLDLWRRRTREGLHCWGPKFNENGDPICLWSDGVIERTSDLLEAPIVDILGELPDVTSITTGRIFRRESPPYELAVSADTKLFMSRDNGATFTLVHTFDAVITDIEIGYDVPTYLRACAGQHTYDSHDGGESWQIISTGGAGSTTIAQASAPWGHAMVATGGASASDALRCDDTETITFDWTEIPTPPNALNAVTAMHKTVGFVVAHSSGEHYQLMSEDATSFLVTPAPTHIGGTEMLIRDGKMSGQHGNGIVYGAGDPTYKMLNQQSILPIDTEASQTIGYCDWIIAAPFVPPEVPIENAGVVYVTTTLRAWYESQTQGMLQHIGVFFNPSYWDSHKNAGDAMGASLQDIAAEDYYLRAGRMFTVIGSETSLPKIETKPYGGSREPDYYVLKLDDITRALEWQGHPTAFGRVVYIKKHTTENRYVQSEGNNIVSNANPLIWSKPPADALAMIIAAHNPTPLQLKVRSPSVSCPALHHDPNFTIYTGS